MDVCMCVCTYDIVCMWVCSMYVCTYARMYIWMYACMRVCMSNFNQMEQHGSQKGATGCYP